jgi:NADH dehydrogenase [ubiquinone] 1 alpha subcomplex assembly factor 6
MKLLRTIPTPKRIPTRKQIPRKTWQGFQSRHVSSQLDQPAAAISSASEIASARGYCLDSLRKYDTPSSLLLPYIPGHARDAYVALRAFNIDVARTADTTSTPTIGAMRLQFQRDAVSKSLDGSPPKQPIAILLAKAAEDLSDMTDGKGKFSKSWFMRIIDTRERYLSNPPYPSISSLESYAENTYSTLLYLTLQALPMASLTADHVASHIGKATGIAAVLRGLPLIAFPGPANTHSNQSHLGGDVGATRHGAVMLPLDIMAETGVREEDVLRNGSSAHGIRDAVFQVATRANDHLITARQMLDNIRAGEDPGHDFEHLDEEEHAYLPSRGNRESQSQEIERAFGVFMPAVAAQLWLDRLQQHDFDVFSPKLRVTDWRLPFKAFWAWNRRKI